MAETKCYVCLECLMNIQADAVEYGRSKERAAIVAWLRDRPNGYYNNARIASEIERGKHVD